MASSLTQSIYRYDRARRRALFEDILSIVSGRSADLLSFEEVRRRLKGRQVISRGLQTIPLDQIVGSVGRYRDFSRAFLPRKSVDMTRWARLDRALNRLEPIPPIEVYRVGDAYFVQDGNHRVSVARANGMTHIDAYVTELPIKVPLGPDDDLDDLIIKAEYIDFLEQTGLDQLRPAADIEFTTPGRYQDLLDHIRVHRYYLAQERQGDVPWEEAVAHWYDNLYLPVVEVIRREGALEHFPGRTEADLYLWSMNHLHYLREQYGPAVDPELAASDFARHFTDRPVSKAVKTVKDAAKRVIDPGDPPEIVERLVDRLEQMEDEQT
jgi:hypothetical protein